MLQKAITRCEIETFIPVDEWEPEEADQIFKHVKGAIILPVSKFYKIEDNGILDYFMLSAKRCYNGEKIRNHCCKYLNYFEKYYDTDKELLMVYYKLKYIIDCEDKRVYTDEAFLYDLKRYILDSMIFFKTKLMNEDNYILNLDLKRSSVDKIKTPSLQYTDKHGRILMEISVLMNMFIPLLVHYMSNRQIFQVKDFLLKAFDMIFAKYEDDVDIYSKLYETSISSINKNADTHGVLWSMQNIRGKNTTTHSISAVSDIILQIMPKYNYNENIVSFNYMSIQWNIGFQVTGISYEYSFVSLSSSKRDEDNNSEFDKFESHLTKQDEALFLQNKVNCESTMDDLDVLFGPFDDDEIDYYIERLTKDNKFIINTFQKDLVFNLFYKYFGDSVSIKAINSRDYIKLIIAAKRMLESNNLVVLPYIISSRIHRLMTRKNVNKKELLKLKNSQSYAYIQNKYKNPKIENLILSMIAGILSSEFEIIDYGNDDIDGNMISNLGDYLIEEMLTYITLI